MTQELHNLLRRQLRRSGVEFDALPSELRSLLEAVNSAYQESDEDRLTVERSLELSSQELLGANAEMRALFEALPDVFLRTDTAGNIRECRGARWDISRLPADPRDCSTLAELLGPQAGTVLAALQRVDTTAAPETLPITFAGEPRSWTYEVRLVPMVRGEQLVVLRDITERVEAEGALRASEERFRSLVQNSSDMIVIVNAEGRLTYASPSVTKIMGYEEEDWQGIDVLSLIHQDQLEEAAQSLRAVIDEPGVHPPKELLVRHRDGSYRGVDMIAQNLLDVPAVNGVVYNARDITERKLAEAALRESEERFRTFAENSADGVLMVNEDGRIVMANAMAGRMFGYAEGELTGAPLETLVPESLRTAHRQHRASFFSQAEAARPMAARGDLKARRRDASVFPSEISLIPLPTAGGHLVAAVIRDVTDRRDLENQLRHQAFHDPLTGLANRARFGDRLEHALERAGRQRATVALLFMDVDNFKSINDGMGHSIGDAALQHVAARLLACLRPGDTAARLGGDEFAILLEDSTLGEGIDLAQQLLDSLRTPFGVGEDEVAVHASIGIAISEGSRYDADGLLRNADIAMYAAKDAGKARYEVYRPSMRSALLGRLTLQRDMERALERREFVVEYQPLIDLETAEIVGTEALVRWRHPRLGLLPPAQFIGIAEESGLIVALGRQVLEESCAQAKRWQAAYPHDPPRTMSVNVSVKQLQHKDFLASLLRVLAETGLDPGSLVLEVTESVMLQDTESTVALLQAIRRHGVRVAIDDFGTGYSSLSYLSRFPFDILKIDKSFIDQTRASEREGVLARAIIELGNTFSVEVVAEGIEDERGLDRLRELNCKIGQGFYFAKPGSAEQVGELLRRATPRYLAA